nr:aminoglycoside phosphotransferase family protein [Gracilibacillus timonensis]
MINITSELAKQLVAEQFPEWSALQVRRVKKGGHDNRTFRLGETMSLRLPSHQAYAAAIEKEAKWLPYLAPRLDMAITTPIAKGEPSAIYPLPWSVNNWLEGEALSVAPVDMPQFAVDLAQFLTQLQSLDAEDGPSAGAHSFYRGGDFAVYRQETEEAIQQLADVVDTDRCQQILANALATKWTKTPVWVHGDIASGNLLVKNRQLVAVIDFGTSAVGDPACDLVMAWTFFDQKKQRDF